VIGLAGVLRRSVKKDGAAIYGQWRIRDGVFGLSVDHGDSEFTVVETSPWYPWLLKEWQNVLFDNEHARSKDENHLKVQLSNLPTPSV
jgi:hypothetical protein